MNQPNKKIKKVFFLYNKEWVFDNDEMFFHNSNASHLLKSVRKLEVMRQNPEGEFVFEWEMQILKLR